MRIRINFSMSARPHIIYFPLVWMDVAKMIADDFQKSPRNSYNMISHVLFGTAAERRTFQKKNLRYSNIPYSSM